MTRHLTDQLQSEQMAQERRASDRRRPDWHANDRRQSWPWVADISDRRSGFDRRWEDRRGGRTQLLRFPAGEPHDPAEDTALQEPVPAA